jgi:SAM-dependent methyltransferase
MGYRLPVISSGLGGPAEIVEEGVTGELIEPGNAGELAEKILQLLRDPARRLRMGAAGFARYQEHFTIEREVRAYEQIYLQLASSNGRRKSPRLQPPNSGSEGGNFRPYWSALLRADGRAEKLALMEIEQAPFAAMLRRFLNGTRGSLRVLEVGTGSAAALRQLAQSVSGVLCGLDLMPEALQVARQAEALSPAPKVQLVAADVFHAPFPDESFDLVFSQGLIEHFPNPGGILQAQARLVKPGGWLVVSVPQTLNPYTLYKHLRMRRGTWEPGWETQYTPNQLSRLAARMGFELLAVDGYGSFLSRVCARLFRPVLSLRGTSRLIRTANSLDRLFGKRLRAWLSLNVVACYRKPEFRGSAAAEDE